MAVLIEPGTAFGPETAVGKCASGVQLESTQVVSKSNGGGNATCQWTKQMADDGL